MTNSSSKKDFDSIFASLSKDKSSFNDNSTSRFPHNHSTSLLLDQNKENPNWSQNQYNTPARNQSQLAFGSNASRLTVNNKSNLDKAFVLLTSGNNNQSFSQTLNSQNSLKNPGIPFANGLPKIQNFLDEFSRTESFSENSQMNDLDNSSWTMNSETDFKAANMRSIPNNLLDLENQNEEINASSAYSHEDDLDFDNIDMNISFKNSGMKPINVNNPDSFLLAHKLFSQD